MPRIFIAIDPPNGTERVAQAIAYEAPELAAYARFVKPNQHHITLAFIDKARPDDLGKVYAVCGQLSKLTKAFAVQGDGWLFFPTPKRARTAAVGLLSEELEQLARNLTDRLLRASFKIDRKPFAPHLTILRVKGTGSADLSKLFRIDPQFGRYEINNFQVIESVPTSEGFEHKTLRRFNLL